MSTPLSHDIFALDLPPDQKLTLLAIDHALSIGLEPNNLAHLARLTRSSLRDTGRCVRELREAGIILGNPISRIDISKAPKLPPFEEGGAQ